MSQNKIGYFKIFACTMMGLGQSPIPSRKLTGATDQNEREKERDFDQLCTDITNTICPFTPQLFHRVSLISWRVGRLLSMGGPACTICNPAVGNCLLPGFLVCKYLKYLAY